MQYISLSLFSTTCFGYPDQLSSGRCWIHKKDMKGERPVFKVVRIIIISCKKRNYKVKINTQLGYGIP